MGGGLMQLVAMGAQDVYLTGNPQITFFKVVYRRHTNFSKEAIAQTFNGSVGLDSSVTCTLSRNGDLVQEIYLRAVIGIETSASNHPFHRLEDMTNLIENVEVEIGGQKIDKHYSQWLDIYNELFETSHDYRTVMSTKINTVAETTTRTATVYLPLRFWFNRNPGLALPLIALQYHEVKINLKFNSAGNFRGVTAVTAQARNTASSVVDSSADTVPDGSVKLSLTSADLLVNYLYLDTDERRRFAQVSHEYLIEQVQHTGVENKAKITMNFNHPVKALFWTSATIPDGNTKLQLNGHDRFSDQDADYFHLVQPYECGLGHSLTLDTNARTWGDVAIAAANNNVSMYSFCLKPAEHQPSGTCNFSRIDNAVLNLGNSNYSGAGVYLFALNYNVLRIMSGMGGLAYSN